MNYLSTVPLFAELPEQELFALASICHIQNYGFPEVVFLEGQSSDWFMVVLEGQVEVVKALGTSDERRLAIIGAGEYLGEMSMFRRAQARSASVRVLEQAVILEIPRLGLLSLLERQPALAFHIMQEMSQRLRNTDEATIRDLSAKNQALFEAYQDLKAAQAQLIAKERLEAELATARKIQQSLLPKETPALDGWRMAAHWEPAREVSGDFYDYLLFEDGRLGLVVGDVTGKGVPAALVMATTRSVLRATAKSLAQGLGNARKAQISPGQLLAQANDILYPDMPPMMFVTCLLAILNPVSGELVMVNAGHCLPFQRSGEDIRELRATGLPLGLMPGMRYEEFQTVIGSGDSLMLFSDGLVEAHDPDGEMFGLPRIRTLLQLAGGNRPLEAEALIAYLLQELADFTRQGWEQEDDVTLVCLQRF